MKLFTNHLENKGFAIINSRLKYSSELNKYLEEVGKWLDTQE